ncbi:MAG: outer membrane protein transport protein [Gammaproteobacteria bacterium]|nr:outer membrane protein transport protein [Gammaproteobacteria bacterium]
MKKIIAITQIITVIIAICIAPTVFAGGYRVSLQGQQAQGMAHAGTAMSDSSEVVYFNPAGMSFLNSDMQVTGGLTLIDAVTKFQNENTNTSEQTDNPIGTPVSLYATKKYDDNLSYGLGIYTPYGNAVEWEQDWAGSHLVNDIELKAIYIQPTISYKINDKYSIGFGPTYVLGSVEFNRNLSTSLSDANGNRSNVTLNADNIGAWGYNVGFLAKPIDKLSIGVGYRSKVVLKARGENADFENLPGTMQSAYADTTFDANLVLPAELSLGFAYKLTPKTTLAFDFNRTFWNAYTNLDVQFDNAAGTSLNPRNYEVSNIYRVGLQHVINEKFTVRGGMYVDKSPIQSGYFTPETARNDSLGLTAGASYQMSRNLGIDLSFLYLTFDEFEGSYDYYDQSGKLVSFGGSYITSVYTLGLGFNYTF